VLDGTAKGPSRRIDRYHPVRHHGGCLRFLPNLMATQEIDTSIVGNSEQPRGQGTLVVEGVKLPIGLEQGVPDNILAVHNRPGHVNSNGAGRGEGW